MHSTPPRGFTLTEAVVTTTIVGIAAAAALIVSGGQSASVKLREAGRLLASDLELAQVESVTHSADPRGLLFNADGSGYRVIALSQPGVALANPLGGGQGTTFGEGRASHLEGVQMYAHSAGADNLIAFGPFGQLDQAQPLQLALISGDRGLMIDVDPRNRRRRRGRPQYPLSRHSADRDAAGCHQPARRRHQHAGGTTNTLGNTVGNGVGNTLNGLGNTLNGGKSKDKGKGKGKKGDDDDDDDDDNDD